MISILTATLFASLLTAQANNHLITWASVSVLYHGEKTPALNGGPGELTALGALQAYGAGAFARERYINGTTGTVVHGMATSQIDNNQLEMLGMDYGYVSASAMAFMQGLYPPTPELGEDTVDAASGLSIQSPSPALNGYQYPALSLVSELDFNYLWVAGNIGCTKYSIICTESLNSAAYNDDVLATSAFYDRMSRSVFWDLQPSTVNYRNALDLYEYALFEHNHNTTLYNSSIFTDADLGQLESLASQQQWQWNTHSSGNAISAIAGKTLASKVMQMFNHNIASSGMANKMTLLFGAHEPFLSFFSLANLSTGPSAERFSLLPAHGSIMTFELFSYEANPVNFSTTAPYPSLDNLWVQFLYRNGTDDLVSYPLFRRGVSEVAMKWTDFAAGMGAFSSDNIVDWCVSCQSITLFCEAIEDNTVSDSNNTASSSDSSPSHTKKTLSPAIAGVVGAMITIATFIIVAAVLVLFGFRMNYREKKRGEGGEGMGVGVLKRDGSKLGGFKGKEKLASDTDLRLKGGVGASVVRHERVGSRELKEGPVSPMDRVVSKADYGRRESEDGEGVDPFADPVVPFDRV